MPVIAITGLLWLCARILLTARRTSGTEHSASAACTQLFLYLKACGREELTTMNLWAGADMRTP
jgi:hypothetical protein